MRKYVADSLIRMLGRKRRKPLAMIGPKSLGDIQGLEYAWIASDADGYVAFPSTAGSGWVSGNVLQNTVVHDEAIDAILPLPACFP
jgi:hypothetical protein